MAPGPHVFLQPKVIRIKREIHNSVKKMRSLVLSQLRCMCERGCNTGNLYWNMLAKPSLTIAYCAIQKSSHHHLSIANKMQFFSLECVFMFHLSAGEDAHICTCMWRQKDNLDSHWDLSSDFSLRPTHHLVTTPSAQRL